MTFLKIDLPISTSFLDVRWLHFPVNQDIYVSSYVMFVLTEQNNLFSRKWVLESVWCLSFSRMKTHKDQWCASNVCFFWVLWWVCHHFQPGVHVAFYLEQVRRVIALNVLPMTIWRKDSRNFERKFGFNSISLPKSKSLTP